jgi:L-asparaginase II
MSAILAEVARGEIVESVHTGVVVALDAAGKMIASIGDVDRVAYFRSAAKPFQAVPLVESGAADVFGFNTAELALACASHDATPAHQRAVARMLAKIGLDEDALQCGVAPPANPEEAARITLGLKSPSQLQCECSGEHAGMLAACKRLGYDLKSYNAPDHPLQQRIREVVARVTGLEEEHLVFATDGCRIPTFGAPIHAFARAYALLASPALAGDVASPIARLRAAIAAHPGMIGGEKTLDSDIIRYSQGRIVAKLGAEGLLCLAVPERELGIAIAIDDGMPRGLAPAAVAVLEQLELLDRTALDALRERQVEKIETFAGEAVGRITPVFDLSARR